ncbi:MAG TPA: tRNA (adenosine(37)-N6)-threonylcarbamoyltransferase complex dimerization subunit type 1 TsaB [Candidatus Deferrimicrobium sp.]|nr:tRNA (adenosine(37)-N6)-threonylcarbamoyltransferase complex dimerization subunit type 1 TsaB [Candidatus Deferrimicrobium sp.]
MTVLAIDSASREHAWVVLATAEGAVVEQRDAQGGGLDRTLPVMIAGLGLDEVIAVVVLTGPGSYSGVRAGMAAALGFAAARSLPLHGVGSLTAIALAAGAGEGTELTAVSDAGRGGVYAARFVRRAGRLEQLSAVQRLTPDRVDSAGRLVASEPIPGLTVEQLDRVGVLAAAVPWALALPPLDPLGLTATHAEPAATAA